MSIIFPHFTMQTLRQVEHKEVETSFGQVRLMCSIVHPLATEIPDVHLNDVLNTKNVLCNISCKIWNLQIRQDIAY